MNRLITIMLMAVLLIPGGSAWSQDPHFSQYYANPLYLNPAFAGTTVCPRLILNFRDQWPKISGTYVTYNASYDMHIEKIKGGIGFLFNTDRAGEGTLNTTNFSMMYSYRLDVSRTFSIKAALQATYFQKTLDWDKLTFPDQISPQYGFVFGSAELRPPSSDLTQRNIDFSAGALGYTEKFFAGVAVHHLTKPDEGFISLSRLPRRITIHAGGIIDLVKKVRRRRNYENPTLSPNILFMQQQNFQQICYGLYFHRFPFVGGLWFRQNLKNADALIIMAGIQASMFKLGYSYDITVSKLTNATGGAHEVSFALQFNCRPAHKRARTINCPQF